MVGSSLASREGPMGLIRMEHHNKHGLPPLDHRDHPTDHFGRHATTPPRRASRIDPTEHDRIFGDNPRGVDAAVRDLRMFESVVRETGLVQFCEAIRLVRRQVNRMLSGAQPNPINRMIATIHAAESKAANRAMQYLCEEIGGTFIPASTDNDTSERMQADALRLCALAAAHSMDINAAAHQHHQHRQPITLETIARARLALDRLQSHSSLASASPDHAAADPSSR